MTIRTLWDYACESAGVSDDPVHPSRVTMANELRRNLQSRIFDKLIKAAAADRKFVSP